jgi:cell division protein FtsZ
MMGTGEAAGEDRALMAAQNAIQNPLLDEVSLKGAKAVLVNVTGGLDMTLLEVDEAANAISEQVDPEANIIFGAAFDPALQGKIRVSVVATGMDGLAISKIEPKAEPKRAPAICDLEIPAAPTAEPVTAEAPEPVVAMDETAEEEQGDLYAAPPVAAAEPAPITRIVDPAVAEDGEADEPLLKTEVARRPAPQPEPEPEYEEPRRGGWRSLFGGRPKIDERQQSFGRARPELRQTQQIEPEIEPEPAPAPEAQDDLEIPSFLRRLAN